MIFLLNIGHVFAGIDIESPVVTASITESFLKSLAPVTPREAGFDEELPGMDINMSIGSLAPVTPQTASFDDIVTSEISIREILQLLAPKTPKEVDFNDPMESINNFRQFSPVTPHEASFEELK